MVTAALSQGSEEQGWPASNPHEDRFLRIITAVINIGPKLDLQLPVNDVFP